MKVIGKSENIFSTTTYEGGSYVLLNVYQLLANNPSDNTFELLSHSKNIGKKVEISFDITAHKDFVGDINFWDYQENGLTIACWAVIQRDTLISGGTTHTFRTGTIIYQLQDTSYTLGSLIWYPVNEADRVPNSFTISNLSIRILEETRGIYNLGRLPCEYQEVEYLQSTGTQWIDTGYKPNNTTGVDIRFKYLTFDSTSKLFFGASDGSWQTNAYGLCTYSNAQAFYSYANSDEHLGVNAIENTNFRFVRNGSAYTLYKEEEDYQTGTLSSGTYSCNNNMYIFASNWAGVPTHKCSIVLYNFKIYDNNALIRDLIPCYRRADNVAGMYDLINGEFYTNQGTGSFIVGNPVSPKNEVAEWGHTYQVQGYSCKYNQQCIYDISIQYYWMPIGVCTHTINENIETLTLTGTPSSTTNCRVYNSQTPNYKNNCKYIFIYDIKASKVCRIVPAIYGNDYAYQFGTANDDNYVNANVWRKCCSFLTINSSGTAKISYLNLYYNYANFVAGDTIQFKNVIIMNLTEAFGSGNEPSNASSFFATQIGKIIASGKYLEYTPNGGILNATAPFTFHYANETRQFTGNLTLRGVGSAYDTWKNSGQVERNFGEVDLGTLSWSYAGSVRWQCFNAQNVKSVAYSNKANALTDKYEIKSFYQAESTGVGLAIYNTYLYNYTSNSTSSPTGIMDYELATTTTDTTSKLVLPDNLIKATDSNGAELTITKLF